MITYSAGAGVFTPFGFADAFQAWGATALMPAALRGANRAKGALRGLAVSYFRREGIGKGIFGKKASGAFGLIKVKAVQRGDLIMIALELRGLAAMQEKGGHTKPHDILPKNKKALKLKIPSQGNVIRLSVHHPGSNVPRHPFADRAMQSAAERIRTEIDREVAMSIARLGSRAA